MQIFFQGGIPMVLALAAGLLGLAIGLGQLVLLRRFDLTPLIACSTLATALVGLLGFCYGLYSGLQGVVHADPSSLAMPLARGLAMALNSLTFALLLAGLQALVGGVVVTVRQLRSIRASGPIGEVAR